MKFNLLCYDYIFSYEAICYMIACYLKQVKYLGVILQNDLKSHISAAILKANQTLGLLKRILKQPHKLSRRDSPISHWFNPKSNMLLHHGQASWLHENINNLVEEPDL